LAKVVLVGMVQEGWSEYGGLDRVFQDRMVQEVWSGTAGLGRVVQIEWVG